MEFSRLVRERHSVRKFTEEPVSKEQLLRLLEETRLAPTAVNHQPQRYLVITEKAGMEKLSRCTKYTFGAPCAIVVCCNRDEAWVNRYTGEMKGEVDAAIAATHLACHTRRRPWLLLGGKLRPEGAHRGIRPSGKHLPCCHIPHRAHRPGLRARKEAL